MRRSHWWTSRCGPARTRWGRASPPPTSRTSTRSPWRSATSATAGPPRCSRPGTRARTSPGGPATTSPTRCCSTTRRQSSATRCRSTCGAARPGSTSRPAGTDLPAADALTPGTDTSPPGIRQFLSEPGRADGLARIDQRGAAGAGGRARPGRARRAGRPDGRAVAGRTVPVVPAADGPRHFLRHVHVPAGGRRRARQLHDAGRAPPQLRRLHRRGPGRDRSGRGTHPLRHDDGDAVGHRWRPDRDHAGRTAGSAALTGRAGDLRRAGRLHGRPAVGAGHAGAAVARRGGAGGRTHAGDARPRPAGGVSPSSFGPVAARRTCTAGRNCSMPRSGRANRCRPTCSARTTSPRSPHRSACGFPGSTPRSWTRSRPRPCSRRWRIPARPSCSTAWPNTRNSARRRCGLSNTGSPIPTRSIPLGTSLTIACWTDHPPPRRQQPPRVRRRRGTGPGRPKGSGFRAGANPRGRRGRLAPAGLRAVADRDVHIGRRARAGGPAPGRADRRGPAATDRDPHAGAGRSRRAGAGARPAGRRADSPPTWST